MGEPDRNKNRGDNSPNLENGHIKRLDRAIATMERTAELYLGGEAEREMKDCARELAASRNVLLEMFDKIDELAESN